MANLLDQASIVLTPTAYDNGKVLCAKPSEPPYGDFDFSRNSAATRVNAQGLVENVQILSSNLVQNGDFSEEGVQEVSNGSFSQEGVQLVTNGDFSNGLTDWIVDDGTSWTNVNNTAFCDGNNGLIKQGFTSVLNKTYKVTFDVVNVGGGELGVRIGSGTYAWNNYPSGSYVKYLVSGSSSEGVLFYATSGWTGSIDNVSVREVGQDWSLGTGWSIGDNKAISNTTASNLTPSTVLVSGKTYKFTLDVAKISAGSFTFILRFNGTNTTFATINTEGSFTFYATADATGFRLQNLSGGTTDFSVTNISVKEVLQDWSVEDYGAVSASAVITPNTEGVKLEKTVSADWRSSFLVQPISYTNGSQYKVTFKLKNGNLPSGGSVYVRRAYDSSSQSIVNNLALTNDWVEYTYYFVADSNSDDISFGEVNWQNAGVGQYFYIDDVSVIEITDDTNLPRINYEGFSYQDALGSELVTGANSGNINASSVYTDIYTNASVVNGKTYAVTFTAQDLENTIQSWGWTNYTPVDSSILYSNGTNTAYVNATGNGNLNLRFYSPSGRTGTLSNISIKEYLGQEVVPDSGCGSWLWEPQSTNLITYSEDLNLSLSSQVDATITNNFGVSPSGQSNSSRIQFADATAFCYGAINISTTHTASVYVKGTSGETISFGIGANVTSGGLFTFNGLWQRIEFTASSAAQIFLSSYSGATATDFEAFGLQLEALSYATSYIPTSGSSVTRNQDLCTNGGSLASINSTEGTLYFEGAALRETNDNTQFLSLGSGSYTSNSVYLQLRSSPNQFAVWAYSNNINQFAEIISVTDITDFNKIAISYKLNDFKVYVNGSVVYTNTTYTPPTDNSLNVLEFTRDGSLPFFGKTKALAVWKEALSDQELADLTYPTPTDPTFALDFDTIATDFTFARGSEATYVDAQGLIQSTNEIGEELVVNGSFDSDTDWNKNGTITISGGTANFNNSASGNNVEQAVTLPSGKQYIATYEITSITEGKFSIYVGGVLSGNQNNQVGVYTEVFTSIGGNAVYVRARGTTTGSIDNVSVKEYTTATNTPRLDYSTGAEAFLLEPQSTNLVTQSELLNGYWSNSGSNNLISEVISPDGISFSQKVTTNSAGNFKGLLKNEGTIWDSKTLTISTFAKKGNTDWLYFYNIGSNNGNNGVWFNLDSGLIGTIGAAWSNVKIETFQNGWYRCSATLSFGAATNYLYILNSDANNSVFSTLDNYAYIWGTQIEENNISSYIPTSGSTVTRNQETCINATPEINSEEGVLYFEGSALVETDTSNRHISISGGSNNDRLYFYYSQSGRFSFASFVGGVLQANITYDGVILNNSKIACKYKENDYSLWVDGVEVGTDTSASVWSSGTLDRINFAEPNGISSLFYGNTKDIQVYTKALSDAELIKLTT